MYLIGLSKEREFVSPISCFPGFMVNMACQDDHQKVKVFLTRHGSWGFVPHLMRSGDATHIVAHLCDSWVSC